MKSIPMYQHINDEKRKWNAELEAFAFQAGNPRAPYGTPERLGWGIPSEIVPRSAVEHIIRMYREEHENLHVHDSTAHRHYRELKPQIKAALILMAQAHFLWLRGAAGARWLMRMSGMEEVAPFYSGYTYIRRTSQNQGDPIPEPIRDRNEKLIGGKELRIFRRWEWTVHDHEKAPCTTSNPEVAADMIGILRRVRSPHVNEPMPELDKGWFVIVSQYFTDWFESGVKRRHDDITPSQWVQSLAKPGTKFRYYESMCRLGESDMERIYRLKDPSGKIEWLTRNDVVIAPNIDIDRLHHKISEVEVKDKYECTGCRNIRTCRPHTGNSKMCCHCYSMRMDPPSRPTLDLCSMNRECRACPDRIDSEALLTRTKNMWNHERRGSIPK